MTGPDAANNQCIIICSYNGGQIGGSQIGDCFWFIPGNTSVTIPQEIADILTTAGYTLT